MVTGFTHLVGKLIWNILVGFVCASLVFVTYMHKTEQAAQ